MKQVRSTTLDRIGALSEITALEGKELILFNLSWGRRTDAIGIGSEAMSFECAGLVKNRKKIVWVYSLGITVVSLTLDRYHE